MKKIESYQCEICEALYDSKEDALECEAQGKETVYLTQVGEKVRYKVDNDSEFQFVDLEVKIISDSGHTLYYEMGYEGEDFGLFSAWGNEEFIERCEVLK